MIITTGEAGYMGVYRPNRIIVGRQKPLIVATELAVKLYTLASVPERFDDAYYEMVRLTIKRKVGSDIPQGIGLGFAMLYENPASERGSFSITMWQNDPKDQSPPTASSRSYTYDRRHFPQGLADTGNGEHNMHEQQIAGFEAVVLDNFCENPDTDAKDKWLNTQFSGRLPMGVVLSC